MPYYSFQTVGLVLAVYIAYMILMRTLRKNARARRVMPPAGNDFTVADLSVMLNKGLLTQDEFERARASILKRTGIPAGVQRPIGVEPQRSQGFEVVPLAKKQEPADSQTQTGKRADP